MTDQKTLLILTRPSHFIQRFSSNNTLVHLRSTTSSATLHKFVIRIKLCSVDLRKPKTNEQKCLFLFGVTKANSNIVHASCPRQTVDCSLTLQNNNYIQDQSSSSKPWQYVHPNNCNSNIHMNNGKQWDATKGKVNSSNKVTHALPWMLDTSGSHLTFIAVFGFSLI